MAIQKLGLTRDQLASFLSDFEQIKQFEKLFASVNTIAAVDSSGAEIEAGNAFSSANEANAGLQQIIDALGKQPQAELGTIASYNINYLPYIGLASPPSWIGAMEGQFWFDPTTGSFNAKMGNNNITQQVGEEIFVYGKASAAITDSPLQIVYQTGVVGSSGVIQFAPTIAGITDGNLILGVATEPIAHNGFGRVTSFGVVRGITTNGTAYGETWVDGDVIWYNPVTGNPTNVKPVAPNLKVQVGTLIKAGSGGSGSIQVEVNHGSVLGGTDSNVQFGTLADKDLIQYYSAGGYWRNVAYSSITVGYAENLSGGAANRIPYQSATNTTVFMAAPTVAGTVLNWNGSGFTWVAQNTGTVTSVDVSGGTTGLSFSGGPVTTSGTITASGTLAAANGGTGQSSYAVGDLLYASTTTALSKLADVATGNALISGGVGVAPSWGKIGLTTHISGTLAVGNGGTGATTFTSGYALKGNGTSAVSESVLYDNGIGNVTIGTTSDNINSDVGIKFRAGSTGQGIATVSASSTSAAVGLSMYSTGAAAYRFYVSWDGKINCTSTTIAAISDVRMKENIRDLDYGLATIMALHPCRFDWKKGKGKGTKNDIGFIAQEVEPVMPEMVGHWLPGPGDPEDLKSLSAGELIPVLVKAIQELTARVAELEGKI